MVEKRFLPRVLTVRVSLPSAENNEEDQETTMSSSTDPNIEELLDEWATSDDKMAAFKRVENAFERLVVEDYHHKPQSALEPIVQQSSGIGMKEPGNPAKTTTEGYIPEQPGYPARFSEKNETAVKGFDDGKPGMPARSAENRHKTAERDYTCFNCNREKPGHTTSQCRRYQGRRFQRRDGERSERFQLFIREKETAMRRIENDRIDEDARIRSQRDDELRAERQAREERYRREDRDLAERRRRQDRLWDDVWDEKVRVYRSGR